MVIALSSHSQGAKYEGFLIGLLWNIYLSIKQILTQWDTSDTGAIWHFESSLTLPQGPKSLCEPILTCCRFYTEKKMSVRFESKYIIFDSRNFQTFSPGFNVLRVIYPYTWPDACSSNSPALDKSNLHNVVYQNYVNIKPHCFTMTYKMKPRSLHFIIYSYNHWSCVSQENNTCVWN